ncbi:hypothetical protein [Jeotgalibacillus soli]|uniref:YknX-like barrel-sandwich hybrid domain-containing protein n=1 Tax=Jeotgalibacillus soli TaxID=889306 RepID=A0A0C2VZI7_9BACL|nr:hypothetical protein [Jeotgalibacillus soli]KIL49796.1 hypothetical protein KP78_12640 [Jeotgalibacillus soli]
MNTRIKWGIAGLVSVLFVGINLYLIKYDPMTIDRTSVVVDPTQAKTEDLEETLVKKGVIDTAREQNVYFSEQLGMFTRFLVEEGQTVSAGTPLYEYTVLDLEEQRLLFESEVEQINSEIESIEEYISTLTQLSRQLPDNMNQSTRNSSPFSPFNNSDLLGTIELEIGIDLSEATLEQTRSLIAQKTGEQEAAVGRLEAEAQKYERLISGLEESPVVTVESDYDGVIAQLSAGLENPLITIFTQSLASKIVLTDEEAMEVISGMAARITSPLARATVDGAVVNNPRIPDEEPRVNEKSHYTVDVQLLDQSEEWFIGQHVLNELVLAEAFGTTTIPVISHNEQLVYVLSPAGQIERRIVDLGLRAEDRQEILTSLEPGEWIAVDPEQVERFNQHYLTPMNSELLTFDNWDTLGRRDNLKHLLLGFIPK